MRAFFACVSFAVVSASACQPCRRIETEPLPIDCEATSTFDGELHFDSPGSFRTFLTDTCLPNASDDEVEELVDSVDFDNDAVFLARGARSGLLRCIEEREAETVDVCDQGLRIVFADVESGNANDCNGLWTVAFKLPREELRAAIDDGDDQPSF